MLNTLSPMKAAGMAEREYSRLPERLVVATLAIFPFTSHF